MKETIKTIAIGLGFFVATAAILILCFIGGNAKKAENERTYNHGVCTECGGHYEFVDVAIGTTEYYYYKCDRCDNIIKLEK